MVYQTMSFWSPASGASQSQSYVRSKEKIFRSLIKRGDRKQMLDVSSLRRELTRLLMTIIWTNYLLCDQPYKHSTHERKHTNVRADVSGQSNGQMYIIIRITEL